MAYGVSGMRLAWHPEPHILQSLVGDDTLGVACCLPMNRHLILVNQDIVLLPANLTADVISTGSRFL